MKHPPNGILQCIKFLQQNLETEEGCLLSLLLFTIKLEILVKVIRYEAEVGGNRDWKGKRIFSLS